MSGSEIRLYNADCCDISVEQTAAALHACFADSSSHVWRPALPKRDTSLRVSRPRSKAPGGWFLSPHKLTISYQPS